VDLVGWIGSEIGRIMDEMKECGLEEPEIKWNGFSKIAFRGSEKGGVRKSRQQAAQQVA